MRIRCVHGYFKFEEDFSGEIARFVNMYDMEIVSTEEGYYTFPFLLDAEMYALAGKPYLGVVATKTYEGNPWEIMRENNLVYDPSRDIVVPIETITDSLVIEETDTYYISRGLIIPGSLSKLGERVTHFSGRYIWDSNSFRYSEIQTSD